MKTTTMNSVKLNPCVESRKKMCGKRDRSDLSIITREELRTLAIDMLRRDDELRLSNEVQQRYAKYPEDCAYKTRVTENVQRQVAREFGFDKNMEEGLEVMRCSLAIFPGDEEIINSAHYLRNNIHAACPLKVGQKIPNIELYDLASKPVSLYDLVKPSVPTVILAGSHT